MRRTVSLINLRSTPIPATSRNGILCHVATAERKPRPTRNVVLTERQEELIETLVTSGRHQNASEALPNGLRLVDQREVEEEGN